MYVHLIAAPRKYKAKIDGIKERLDKFIITVKDFNTLFLREPDKNIDKDRKSAQH